MNLEEDNQMNLVYRTSSFRWRELCACVWELIFNIIWWEIEIRFERANNWTITVWHSIVCVYMKLTSLIRTVFLLYNPKFLLVFLIYTHNSRLTWISHTPYRQKIVLFIFIFKLNTYTHLHHLNITSTPHLQLLMILPLSLIVFYSLFFIKNTTLLHLFFTKIVQMYSEDWIIKLPIRIQFFLFTFTWK